MTCNIICLPIIAWTSGFYFLCILRYVWTICTQLLLPPGALSRKFIRLFLSLSRYYLLVSYSTNIWLNSWKKLYVNITININNCAINTFNIKMYSSRRNCVFKTSQYYEFRFILLHVLRDPKRGSTVFLQLVGSLDMAVLCRRTSQGWMAEVGEGWSEATTSNRGSWGCDQSVWSPRGPFFRCFPGPTRRMLGPPPQFNSHGNYLLRTYSEKSFGISDHNQFIQQCLVKSSTY